MSDDTIISFVKPLPLVISFVTAEHGMLFTIHADGRIERGPAFTTEDAASLAFWELIANAYPAFREAVVAEIGRGH